MKIILKETNRELYFSIIIDIKSRKTIHDTSELISKVLGLNVEQYNHILINKIIQHSNYRISDDRTFGKNDLFFHSEGTLEKTYLKRFKEAFTRELTVLALSN